MVLCQVARLTSYDVTGNKKKMIACQSLLKNNFRPRSQDLSTALKQS